MRSFKVHVVPASPTSSPATALLSLSDSLPQPHTSPIQRYQQLCKSTRVSHFRPSHMLFPPAGMSARVTPTCVSAFHLLWEAFLVPLSSCPAHPTSHQQAGSSPLSSLGSPAPSVPAHITPNQMFDFYSLLYLELSKGRDSFSYHKSQGPPQSPTISEEFSDSR